MWLATSVGTINSDLEPNIILLDLCESDLVYCQAGISFGVLLLEKGAQIYMYRVLSALSNNHNCLSIHHMLKMASKRPTQVTQSLIDMSAVESSKRPALEDTHESEDEGSLSDPSSDCELETSDPVSGLTSRTESNSTSTSHTSESVCTSTCCSDDVKPFQPTSKEILGNLTFNGRKFVAKWFEQYPWLTVCVTKRKIVCFTVEA